MSKHLALSCEIGDPADPSVWSGTPFNIINALKDFDIEVHGINGTVTKMESCIARLSNRFLNRIYLTQFGPVEKWFRSRKTHQFLQSEKIPKVLHMCAGDTPVYKSDERFEHYLFLDTTFRSLLRYSVPLQQYSKSARDLICKLEKKAYSQMRHIFSISDYVREDLMSLYDIPGERIATVGTGSGSLRPFTGVKNYSVPTVLFVAKCRFEEKGGAILVEGFKRARLKLPALRLVIAGGECPPSLIVDCPEIHDCGRVPFEKLQELFNEASLFAMPAFNEPWGLVYLEALACKAPVLGIARNSIPEITNNGAYGFFAHEPTPDSIADALCEAFLDINKLRKMGENGQRYVADKYTWNRTAGIIAEVIFKTC